MVFNYAFYILYGYYEKYRAINMGKKKNKNKKHYLDLKTRSHEKKNRQPLMN